jgi:hypothetical protein
LLSIHLIMRPMRLYETFFVSLQKIDLLFVMNSYTTEDTMADDFSGSSGWKHWKQQAKEFYQRNDYHDALQAYRRCLLCDDLVDPIERSVILGNMVACRLQLGGPAHSRAAVTDARECVRLNPTWAKAHWRLGSALSATDGESSNEACNALQTCLRLDANFPGAKQLLLQELRRRDPTTATRTAAASEESRTPTGQSSTENTNPPPPQNPNYHPSSEDERRRRTVHAPPDEMDDGIPWRDRLSMMYTRLSQAYASQTDSVRSLWQVAAVLLLLYVAFGGRFGFEYLFSSNSQPQRPSASYNSHDATYETYGRHPRDYSQGGGGDSYESSHRGSSSSTSSTDDSYHPTRTNSGGSWWGSSSYESPHNNYGGSMLGGLSWLFGAGMTLYLYQNHGLYAAAMFVWNRLLGRRGMHQGGFGGGLQGGLFGRQRRGRGWW